MGKIANFFGNLRILLQAAAASAKLPAATDKVSFPRLVEDNARRYPNQVALICEGEQETWQGLNDRANRVAGYLREQGVAPGDCITLFMENRIEFLVQLTAISKLGAVASLINTNLGKQQLIHCITLTDSKKCIFGEELAERLNEVRDQLPLKDGRDYLWVRDQGEGPAPNWAAEVDSKDAQRGDGNPPETQQIEAGQTLFYIFTSGTTGLPKAALISHKRLLPAAGMSANLLLRINHKDRMYNCLPLYHGTGLMIGITAAFTVGASSVLRRKLSVSAFWEDIRKHDCTCFIYIGEFIRYLMSQPASRMDKENKVRAIVGNGLRPDIWLAFKQRFGIERIGEFYGASEGNGGFANLFNKDCTVGLGTVPAKIVAYDIDQDEILRDAAGHCIEQPDGEPGLLLLEITEKSKFEGYTDPAATEKKVLKNAFVEGDAYFNSGDLMKVVDVGFTFGQKHYQFVDRVGDTFRWKSENVSTNEVGEIINQFPDIAFANVYGVQLPGADGRAGMAALVLRQGLTADALDLPSLSAHICDNLSSYARPLFLRLQQEQPTTSTHKLQKTTLRDQAFHIDKVQDPLFVLRPGDRTYTKLDSDFYDQIMQRRINF